MKYQNKSFTVASPGTKEYADNWERTFRGGGDVPPKCSRCNEVPQKMDPALAGSARWGASICCYCGYWVPRRERPTR